MTETAVDLGPYWGKELASLRRFRERAGHATYRDWQPTKWQSLRGLIDTTLERCAAAGSPPRSAIELGCGSATISIKLAKRGLAVTSVDMVPEALQLARECCEGLALPAPPKFVLSDFCRKRLSETVESADLVLSGGVIEHWEVDGQREVLRRHLALSNRWVLLTVPNLDSPVFRSFIRWAKAADRFYGDDHYDISVPELAEHAACEVALMDACRLFLTRCDHYSAGDSELDDFYAEMRSRLVAAGGKRYAAFPKMTFNASDIDVLYSVERAATTEERMRFGFLQYFLLDANHAREATLNRS
jgi:SAM-dependent methyltransferase